MDDTLQQAFNDQIALEYASSYSYLQMAAWADDADLSGMAAWFRSQSAEELVHAHKFIDFVLDRGKQVVLQDIAAPQHEFADVVALFDAALAHEEKVTRSIGQLYAAAQSSADYQSLPLLSWFLEEQVEEEASVRTILGELRMVAGDPSAVLMLDRELPARRAAEEDGA